MSNWGVNAPKLRLTISENAFQSTVLDYAILKRWQVAHFRPAKNERGVWATQMSGHPGFPDLTFARDGIVFFAELKSHTGRASPAQTQWLAALGKYGFLWTPQNWNSGEVMATLNDGPRGIS